MAWYAWLIIFIFAVVALILLLLALEESPNPEALFLQILSWAGAVVSAAIATTALTLAVLLPTKTPDWLREAFGLESGDKSAATPWVRWALVVIAIAVLILPRLWGRAIWPDVALALLITIAIFATVKQHHNADKQREVTPSPTVRFGFGRSKVTTLGPVPENKEAFVFVVRSKTVSNGTVVNYESQRYKATRVGCELTNRICIAVERGEGDASLISFTAAIQSPARIYLLPRK